MLVAAQQVSAAIPNVAFLLAGEGELMGSLQTLAKELGIGELTFGSWPTAFELIGRQHLRVLQDVVCSYRIQCWFQFCGAGVRRYSGICVSRFSRSRRLYARCYQNQKSERQSRAQDALVHFYGPRLLE
jgi:hypothetical protein